MITRTFTSLAVMTALGVFLPVTSGYAFGLGKIELSSALNQPFKAQIPVTALRDEEKGNLQVQLASASEFERAGLERSYYLTQFEFNIVEHNGVTTIDISSKQAVKEPFIDLLLTATAGSGRLIREYTVLLDPPKDIFVKPPVKTQTVTTTTTQTSSSQPSYTASKYQADRSYGPTDRNDTLWNIARKTKPSDASINQMMMALLDENPNAFTNNNINGLKAGYTLSLPAVSAITKRSKAQAIADVTQQNTSWKNRNVKPAPSVEVVVEPALTEQSLEENTFQPETMPANENDVVESTTTEVSAQLKLVAPSDDVVTNETEMSPMGDDQLTSLSEQLTLAQETIETQTQENIDIKARMAAMEEQIETLRRLLSLKDPDLALMQSTLEKQANAMPTDEAQPTQEEGVSTDDMAETQTAVVDSSEELQSADAEPQPSYDTEMSADEVAQTDISLTEAEVIKADTEATSATDEAIEKALDSINGAVGYVSDLTGLDQEQVKSKYEQVKTYILEHKQTSALGSLALLLLIWLIIRFRNRPYVAWDEAVGDTKATPAAIAESDETLADDYSDELEPELATAVVEEEPEKTVEQLVSDADVYVSYGDFAKAKQSLQAAYDDQPKNEEVIHKLLFVLFKQSQVNDFITLATYYQNETTASEWDDVISWGQQLAPDEALFQAVPEVSATDTIENEQAPIETLDLDDSSNELETLSTTSAIDDELSNFDINQVPVSDNEVSSDLTDDVATSGVNEEERLNLPEVDAIDAAGVEIAEQEVAEPNNNVMEFDLDINNGDSDFELSELDAVTDEDLTEANNALAESELEFDLGEFDQVDEAETKLDLAAAYIDMGDPSGAKSILEEVLTEGNDDQKSRAEAMLSDIK